ncbi:hypothetical protein KFU94_26855 [Chloroflexi bacterium TSY]|nr:hypothetical protein [Chloroflexi bacterium TSY]
MAINSIQQPSDTPLTTELILTRLDAIMSELQAIRQAILITQHKPTESVVDGLWGSLGQGTPEELQAYDKDIYMDIFSDEPAS